MASPILKSHLFSRLRQRGSPKTSKTREQIVFVLSVEGIVTLKLAFSATLDAVLRPLFRARYHSLSRLKDAYMKLPRCRLSKIIYVGYFPCLYMSSHGVFTLCGGGFETTASCCLLCHGVEQSLLHCDTHHGNNLPTKIS